MGWLRDNDYELRIARRDGRAIQRNYVPHPVVETFDIDDNRQVKKIVGKHYVRMAAAAEGKDVPHWERTSKMKWLPEYQCEIWRTWGNPTEPELISFSTEGWNE